MAGCIENNPFRVLGVYSNASAKDIAGNKSRMQAYLKVNREVSFPLDNAISLPIQRNQTIVEAALSEINLSHDKIRHALFWFIKGSPIDEMAIQHLAAGNTDKFFDLLIRKGDYCSQINKAVYAMAVEDFEAAVIDMTAIIHDDDNREAFVSSVCGEAFSISEDDLAHLYIDTLLDCYPDVDWRQIFIDFGKSGEDDDYISDKIVGKPVSEIHAEISKAKSVARDDARANLKAGKQLILSTKANLAYLKEILGSTNSQYQMIADKLALQILQNGINFFNNVDDSDGIDDAMKIQSYAQKIAVGKVAKDRCNENVAILKEIKAKMPPSSVSVEDAVVKNLIRNTSSESQTFETLKTFLVSSVKPIVSIKEKLGKNNPYYLKISTSVVNTALGKLIELVNESLRNIGGNQYRIELAKEALNSAWHLTQDMDVFDVEATFKSGRFKTNKDTLHKIISESDGFGLFGFVKSYTTTIDLRTIDERFNDCNTSLLYDQFIADYPNSTYIEEAKRRKQECYIREEQLCYDKCKKINDFSAYVKQFPNGVHIQEAQNAVAEKKRQESIIYSEFKKCNSIHDFEQFKTRYPGHRLCRDAESKIQDIRKKRKQIGCTLWKILCVVIIECIWGLISINGDGFWAGIGYSILGWLFYINVLAYIFLYFLGKSIFNFED